MNRATVNDVSWFGIPAGRARLSEVRTSRPPWYRRLWAWLRRRPPHPWQVTYTFDVVLERASGGP